MTATARPLRLLDVLSGANDVPAPVSSSFRLHFRRRADHATKMLLVLR